MDNLLTISIILIIITLITIYIIFRINLLIKSLLSFQELVNENFNTQGNILIEFNKNIQEKISFIDESLNKNFNALGNLIIKEGDEGNKISVNIQNILDNHLTNFVINIKEMKENNDNNLKELIKLNDKHLKTMNDNMKTGLDNINNTLKETISLD